MVAWKSCTAALLALATWAAAAAPLPIIIDTDIGDKEGEEPVYVEA